MTLYHGTTSDRWQKIQHQGLKSGSLASERAFALSWQGNDTVVVEVIVTSDQISSGALRVYYDQQCTQYDLADGVTILPSSLRRVMEDELIPDRQFLKTLRERNPSGEIKSNVNGSSSGRHELTVGNGESRLSVETGSGDVEISL